MTIDVPLAVVGMLGTTLVVLFHGGRQVGRVEAAVARLSRIEAKLDQLGDLSTRIGTLEGAYTTLRSDHKELSRRFFGHDEPKTGH